MKAQELIDSRDWEKLLAVAKENVSEDIDNNYSEYENNREIRDDQVGNREDKVSKNGEVRVNRIPVPFQRKIVQTATAFLFGNPVHLSIDSESGAEEPFKAFSKQWRGLRLDSLLIQATEAAKSQTSAAIVLRVETDGQQSEEEAQDAKLKATVLTKKNGNIYPVFNEFRDMVAFIYEYKSKNEDDEEVTRMKIYLQENVVTVEVQDDEYVEIPESSGPHFFKRIPVVYISQDNPEWFYVQELIDRYEMNLSKFADVNDYFASPLFKAKGEVNWTPERDNTGEVYKLDIFETDHGNVIQSDMDILSWDHAPESVKLEFEEIKGLIYSMTSTPDLAFDNVKGLGNVSGVALQLLFLDTIIKSKFEEGTYKTAVERLINILRAGMIHGTKEMQESFFQEEIFVEFQSVLPKDLLYIIQMLAASTDKPIMSQQTAVENNPFVENAKEEMDRLGAEETKSLGESFGIDPTLNPDSNE
jgi:SPP1 family phage portal protein